MSKLETDTGQTETRPNIEGHDNAVLDKDAESVKCPQKRHQRQRVIGFTGLDCLRLITFKMINICKEIGLMLLIAFTYAALVNDPPKVSKSPPAYPFFPKGSIVKDYYRGQLSRAIQEARLSDVAFVMYYAPWDAESQEIRREFELAARYMQKLVSFNAVNCWHPNGECRSHYTKIYDWPILIAYPTHGRGIQYNGPKTALHMMRFLKAFMEPLVRVNNLEVERLRRIHDAVVVANVNSLPGSLDYATVYNVALKHLERDPFQELIFAINTECNGCRSEISLYTWDNTVTYVGRDWKVDKIANWIHKNAVQVSIWASPSGTKSQELSNYLQPGPSLILFTPRNPLFDTIDYYDMLHEVALQYNYCKNNTHTFGAYLLSLSIHYQRLNNYKQMKTLCKETAGDSLQKPNLDLPKTVTYTNTNKWTNNSYCLWPSNKKDTCTNNDITRIIETKFGQEAGFKDIGKLDEMYKIVVNKNVEDTKKKTTWTKADYIFESYRNLYKTSMLTGVNDPKSAPNLYKIRVENRCRWKSIAERYSPPLFSKSITNNEDTRGDVAGLGCQVNRSLSIVALDSLKYHHFANSLSIDILKRRHKTALVILDEKMESHYVLDQPVTDTTIREFIQNYHQNRLNRASTKSTRKFNYTHVYTPPSKDTRKENIQSILELDSSTFLPTVMKKLNAVIVLYHSKQCSFCNGISYTFLTTAKIFSPVTNLQFARIDGDLNTLPWEYTMESYPTILFFPDVKKSESRVFPRTAAVTVVNLIQFILSNLSPTLKLHAMWSLCSYIKFEEEKRSCTSEVRIETLSLIEKTLKEWRLSDSRDKAAILDKLRELKHVHLLLAHHPANSAAMQKYMTRLHSRITTQQSKRKKTRKPEEESF